MNRELLYRFFRCETTTREEETIMNWLDANDKNRDNFEAEREIFNALTVHAPGIDKEQKPEKNKVLRITLQYAAAVAAAVCLVAGASYMTRNYVMSGIESKVATISVPTGQRINLTLEDGTKVWLNSDAELEHPVLFGKERRVVLRGEAMFEVEHDAARPFIVETFAGDLEVLGTKFNVEARAQAGIFTASLLEGKLRVTDKTTPAGGEYIMMPDDKLTLAGGTMSLTTLRNHNDFLWAEGIISFEDIAFDELMKQFEKHFDVTIRIERSTLPSINYSRGKIRIMDGLDHAIRTLQVASDFTYEKHEESRLIIIK